MLTLVTGATGLVGNNVVRALLQRGQAVRVLVREQADPRPLAGLDVERVVGDVRDAAAVRAACRGVDRIVHAAARVHIGWSELDEQREINVGGTRHVAVAAREAGCRLVHVSSVDALGIGSPEQPADEFTPVGGKTPCSYVVTKREAEQIVLAEVARGLDAVIVNPGFMLGPWDWKPSSGQMLLAVADRFTAIAPTGGCSVCDVRDVAAAILAALDREGVADRYVLAGHNVTYFAFWKQIAAITGGRSPWLRAGPLVRLLAGRGGDTVTWLTGRERELNSASIAMSSLFHYYDSTRARTDLAYHNRALNDSIQDAWEWFQQQGYTRKSSAANSPREMPK